MNIVKLLHKLYWRVRNQVESNTAKNILEDQLIGGKYKRVYQYHIHKTGGTSVNVSFFNLSGQGDLVNKVTNVNSWHRGIVDSKVYVRWNRTLLEQGNYFYGVSHSPYHRISVPQDSFTFTILRDPVKRIISQYKNVLQEIESGSNHPVTRIIDHQHLGSVDDFVANLTLDMRLNQVAIFSKENNIKEAERIIRSLDFFFFLEEFNVGMKQMAEMLDLPLEPVHARKSALKTEIVIKDEERIRELMQPEIDLYDRLWKSRKSKDRN